MRFDMLNFTLIGQTRHPLGQENWKIEIIESFLADRTNGRAVGTLLRPSVCLSSSSSSSVSLCIVAKRCVL